MENNQIQVFENTEFGKVRVIEENGKFLFCGNDVAKVLGYNNPRDALSRHCKPDGVVKRDGVTETVNQYGKKTIQMNEMSYITESNVYRLITHSKLPDAEKFELWVFDEVLPTIRKTGGYVANDDLFISTYLPSADDATKLLFKTTLETMRNLNEQNVKLKQEVEHKENVIVGLVKDIDLADKRQRITQIIRKGQGNGSSISARYALLYTEFEKKYHVNLSVRLERYRNCYKPNLKNNLDLIDKQMNMIPELYEICCKLFENEYNEIMKTWQSAINTENVE